ncbi:GFA family protein [Parerythrobacter lacustris]|uniref:GFA family protein n=1 Tax=Parerythrobacter lacustris TaxID=2969984 RepID=A0ABT1XRX6_9SPHN|nr:GFA family protein [Parerythrobacter lacustris]MCR2834413.1 GFA family protein [Parerythrobacter lacustris]
MALSGGCQCGAVRYEAEGEIAHHALCHCADCRASTGAPAVAWMAVPASGFHVTSGEAIAFNSSGSAFRHFCGKCGTGLYYTNEDMLPGIVDIQSATLDDAANHKPDAQIQTGERLDYMAKLGELPEFTRFPGV